MPLTDPFRRAADRPSLRERAASLRTSIGTPPKTNALPAPGSAQAMTAFHAACHEDTIRSADILDGYPDLKRTALEWWTVDSLGKAMETGEITPAECARLYPLATERELRMAEIHHELNLGALHALAFADSYPVPATSRKAVADDAELIRLGHLFEVARKREAEACETYNEASREARRNMPERPAALVFRASDHSMHLPKYFTHPEDLEGREITSEDVAWMGRRSYTRGVQRPVRPEDNLPSDAKFVVESQPWPEAQARADEIVATWDAWHAERNAVRARYVTPALEAAAVQAGEVAINLAERMAALPAHTADGFRVKLQALAQYRQDVLDSELETQPDRFR